MVAYTAARSSTRRHCAPVNERHRGRPAASSTTAAIHWRTATTPAGPMVPNASAPVAAPSWLDRAPPSIIPGPAPGRPSRAR